MPRNKRITITADENFFRVLQDGADKSGVTLSEYMRRMLLQEAGNLERSSFKHSYDDDTGVLLTKGIRLTEAEFDFLEAETELELGYGGVCFKSDWFKKILILRSERRDVVYTDLNLDLSEWNSDNTTDFSRAFGGMVR